MSEFEELYGKEFFVIDSNNLNSIEDKTYGFTLENLYDDITNENIEFNHEGSYLSIKTDNKSIIIEQDFNGSYGLYLFKKDEYFAISNSFLKLTEYLKNKYELSFNEDYSNQLLYSGLCSILYKETPINEIEELPRNISILIDKQNNTITFKEIDYEEHSLSIDSIEGMTVLDNWFKKWIKIIRSLKKKTNNIQFNLSGGFDTRVILSIMLNANIDLNKVKIYSIDNNRHTHREDYKIATEIANEFGFKLNEEVFDTTPIPFKDVLTPINTSAYLKLGFHNQFSFRTAKHQTPIYSFPGSAGETIRSYYDSTPEELLNKYKKLANNYDNSFVEPLEKSLKNTFEKLRNDFNISDKNSKLIPDLIYSEIRARHHFGKLTLEQYFTNNYMLTALLDCELHKLKTTTDECNDSNLLMAVIFTRYCPKLLDFKFQGKRKIDENTITYAKNLNNKYSFVKEEYTFISGPEITKNNKYTKSIITHRDINNFLKNVFYSKGFKKEFKKYISPTIYNKISDSIQKTRYFPLSSTYPVFSYLKMMDVINSKENLNFTERLETFLIDQFSYDMKDLLLTYNKIQNDIKNYRKKRNYIEFNSGKELNFLDLFNNTAVYNVLQQDKGIQGQYTDCWSEENIVQRQESNTILKNDSNKLLFSFLTDNDKKRLILPTSFKIKFRYVDHENVSLRLVNLGGSYINISLTSLDLDKNSRILISYNYNTLKIYVNDELVKTNEFVMMENKGYITWRLPKNSFIEFNDFVIMENKGYLTRGLPKNSFIQYNDFVLYNENNIVSTFFTENSHDEDYSKILEELIKLEERIDEFKEK